MGWPGLLAIGFKVQLQWSAPTILLDPCGVVSISGLPIIRISTSPFVTFFQHPLTMSYMTNLRVTLLWSYLTLLIAFLELVTSSL